MLKWLRSVSRSLPLFRESDEAERVAFLVARVTAIRGELADLDYVESAAVARRVLVEPAA